MVKKVVLAVFAAVLVFGGFGIQQATASESLPEGSLMRRIDVRNCAESGVQQGDHGHCVWILQVALKREGYSISTDGSFGPKTAAQVYAFNKAHIIRDGQQDGHAISHDALCETYMTLAEKLQPSKQQQKGTKYHDAWVADTI